MPHPRLRPRAVVASLLLAACSAAEPEPRQAGGDSAAAPARATAPPGEPGTRPVRTAADLTGHSWQELVRDPTRGEWINPAPGLSLAFRGDEPSGGIAAEDPADPTLSFQVYPNHRVAADGRGLAESRTSSIGELRVANGGAMMEVRESYRIAAEPEDLLGTRVVRIRVTPEAGEKGIYRWEFSYADPDPCAARRPCTLRHPLWVGTLGTRYFERSDPADGHRLDQTEPGDESTPQA